MVAQPWTGPADKDHWHVLMAPGETKILSLEQLDDFFRLEVIDGDTRVWQPGMTEWLPLSVVAGLDDEPAPAPKPARPPAPPSRRPAPPAPSSRAPAPVLTSTLQGWPAPAPVAATNAWPPAAAPAPQTASAWPNSAPAARPQPAVAAFAAPESLRPMVADRSYAPPKQGSRLGGWLIGLAVLGAAGVTLYRNDVLREAAKSAGQEQAYLQLERSLGSPGFGTPRAVEHLAALAPNLTALDAAIPTLSARVERARTPEPVEAPAPAPSPAPSPTETAASPSDASKSSSLESLVAAQVGGSTLKKASPPRREAPSRSTPARRERERPEPSLGIKGSSNRFDPLNGKL